MADIVIEMGWIRVRRQLLKGQQNLVCFSCRRGILTAKLRLTCGPRLLLFAWRSSRGAVENHFLSWCHHERVLTSLLCNSCHHVRVVFCLWAVEMNRVMKKVPHFGVGIVWETIPSGLPVFWIIVPGCSRNSYGTIRTCKFRRSSSSFEKAPKIRDSVLLNSFESFLVPLPSISSEIWEI